MAKEVVVTDSLTGEMVSAGEELVSRLAKTGFVVSAALWLYLSESEAWRFFIVNPEVETEGWKKAYKKVQSVIGKIPEEQPKIALKDISIVDSKDPLISPLKAALKREAPGAAGVRFSRTVLNGVFIDDAYIYRAF
jgi:hypothetical protein